MKLPDHLLQSPLADLPLQYDWTRIIANSFQANPGEKYRKLFDAIERLGLKVSFALAIACNEWVAARLRKHVDISDALLRIEAAWAATLDWRYARLPMPLSPGKQAGAPPGSPPNPTAEPVWVALLQLTDGHDAYVTQFRQPRGNAVRSTALRAALVAQHVCGAGSGYQDWLSASLRLADARAPRSSQPIDQEAAVARESFEPGFSWDAAAVAASQTRLRASLDPARNPYLRPRDELLADGLTDPYPQQP